MEPYQTKNIEGQTYLVYKAQKVFRGYVSPRDYVVKKCVDSKKGLIIDFDNYQMFISPTAVSNHLEKKKRIHEKKFQSQYDPDLTYKFIDFLWKPTHFKWDKLHTNLF